MANSLRAKLKKLKHDGKINQQELDELIKKLDGHDRELKEQIPKWHLVADGDLPPIRQDILIVLRDGDMSTGFLSDDYFYVDCISKKHVELKNVIAWSELPKFEGVE